MAAKKQAAKKKVVGGSGEMEKVVLTAEHLVQYPELKEQGFVVGQEIEAPEGTYDLEEAEEAEDKGRSKEDEASMKSEATGKWVVKMLAPGSFRLYNELGQAVSPVCDTPEKIQEINRQASRANALIDSRKIGAKKGPGPAPTVQ